MKRIKNSREIHGITVIQFNGLALQKWIRFFNTSNIGILSRKNLNKDNTTYFGLD